MAVVVTRPYTDFVAAPGNEPDFVQLEREVASSAPALSQVLVSPFITPFDMNPPKKVGFHFAAAIDGPSETQLDVLVAAHLGVLPLTVIQTFRDRVVAPDPSAGILVLAGTDHVVFELEADLIKDDAVSQTASGTFQQKLDTSNPGPNPTLIAGTYRVEWMAIIGGTLTSTLAEFRVEVDGTELVMHVLGGLDDSMTDVGMSGFDDIVLAAGLRNFKMEFRKTAGGGSARISHARLAYRRVGL